jgi:transposase
MLHPLFSIKQEDNIILVVGYEMTFPRFDGHTEQFVSWTGGVCMGKKDSRHFTREFKRNAVQMVIEKGMPVGRVAQELDIHPNLLHQWKRKLIAEGDDAFIGKGNLKPEDAELKRLQRELEEVKEERDILKKALGVFSKRIR